MKYKAYKFDSYRVFTIESDAFKSCHMEFKFLDDATKINMPMRFLLTSLMAYTTKKYQTKRDLLIALEELYDSNFRSETSRMGETFVSTFKFDFLNPNFVKEKDYLEKIIEFATDSLLNPDIEAGKYNERSVMIKKEIIHSNIDRYKEDALKFAIHESKKVLFDDGLSSKEIYGTHEEIDGITPEDLANDYQKMFQDSAVDILIIGDLDMDKVINLIEKYFVKQSIVEKNFVYQVDNKIKEIEELEVKGKYVQTQLLMYLQFNNLTDYERFVVSKLYSEILGHANQTDKLAKYLRIDNPLAYYAGCQFNFSEQFLVLYTGMKYENVLEGKEGMNRALNEMLMGNIDEDYFLLQKNKVLSNILMNEDNMYYLIRNYYYHEIIGDYLVEDLKESIKKVTIDDIKELASKLSKTLTYVLREIEQ